MGRRWMKQKFVRNTSKMSRQRCFQRLEHRLKLLSPLAWAIQENEHLGILGDIKAVSVQLVLQDQFDVVAVQPFGNPHGGMCLALFNNHRVDSTVCVRQSFQKIEDSIAINLPIRRRVEMGEVMSFVENLMLELKEFVPPARGIEKNHACDGPKSCSFRTKVVVSGFINEHVKICHGSWQLCRRMIGLASLATPFPAPTAPAAML